MSVVCGNTGNRQEIECINCDCDKSPRSPGCSAAKYRLLTRGEVIQKGDQVLCDDTVTWLPLVGWEVGAAYEPNVYMPVRRESR